MPKVHVGTFETLKDNPQKYKFLKFMFVNHTINKN